MSIFKRDRSHCRTKYADGFALTLSASVSLAQIKKSHPMGGFFVLIASFGKGYSPARGNVAKRQKGCRLGERGQLIEGLLFVLFKLF